MSEKVRITSAMPEDPAASAEGALFPPKIPVESTVAGDAPTVVPEAVTQPEAMDPLALSEDVREDFAAQVEYVLDKGDALGRNKFLRQATLGFKSTLWLTVGLPAIVAADGGQTAATVLGLSTLSVSAVAFRNVFSSRGAVRAMNRGLQQEMDERFDLLKIPGDKQHAPSLALRYYGPLSARAADSQEPIKAADLEASQDVAKPVKTETVTQPEGLRPLQRVQRMATLAKENDVRHVILGVQFAESLAPKGGKTVKMRDILELKDINPDKGWFEKDDVIIRTPDFWLGLTERTQQKETEQYVESLLEKIRQADPNHALVGLYDEYAPYLKDYYDKDGPDTKDIMWVTRTEKMVSAVQRDVERYYSETTIEKPSAREKIEGVDPRPRKRYLHAALEDDDLVWTHNGQFVQGKSLAETIGFDAAILTQLADNPRTTDQEVTDYLQAHPDQTAVVLSSLVVKRLKQEEAKIAIPYKPVDETPKAPELIADPLIPATNVLLSSGVRDPLISRAFGGPAYKRRRITQIAAGVLAASAVAAMTFESGTLLDKLNNEAEVAALHASGRESMPSAELHDLAARQDWTAATWGSWKQLIRYSEEFLTPDTKNVKDKNSDKNADASGLNGVVGNIESGSQGPKVDWSLEAHGMSTAGYWYSATSPFATLTERGIAWEPNNFLAEPKVYLLPVEAPAEDVPSIKVTRWLSEGDHLTTVNGFKVPTLENTKPIAASVDGQQVAVAHMQDGTYGLTLPAGMTETTGRQVTYWLGKTGKGDAFPHATAPVSALVDNEKFEDGDAVRRAWDDFIPGFSQMDKYTQQYEMHKYISENFVYRLKPFDDSFDRDAENLPDYTRRTLALGKGFCASVNGLTVLETLGQNDMPVNLASGYHIGKDNATSLSSNAGHAWGVDEIGDPKDNTPGRDILPEDAAYLNGTPTAAERPASSELPYWPFGVAAGMGILALGYVGRRPVGRIRQTYLVERAVKKHERLLNTDPELLRQAGNVIDAVLYDPGKDIEAALARGRSLTDEAESGLTGSRLISSEHLVGKLLLNVPGKNEQAADAAQKVKEAKNQTSTPEVKARLTAINGLLKTARFIKRYPKPLPQPTLLEDIIE